MNLLVITVAFFVCLFSSEVTGNTCYYAYQYTVAQSYTKKCGWLNRRRCTRYRAVNMYSTESKCCTGYTGTPPNCIGEYVHVYIHA
jgi:hypothetical protein